MPSFVAYHWKHGPQVKEHCWQNACYIVTGDASCCASPVTAPYLEASVRI